MLLLFLSACTTPPSPRDTEEVPGRDTAEPDVVSIVGDPAFSIISDWASAGFPILVNEILVADERGGVGDQVELYNTSDQPFSLEGYQLWTGGSAERKVDLTPFGALDAYGFLALSGGCEVPEGSCVNLALNYAGDALGVCESATGDEDCVVYEHPQGSTVEYSLIDPAGQPIARVRDGGSEWAFAAPTLGAPNAG